MKYILKERNKRILFLFEISLLIIFCILFPFVRKDILVFSFYTVIYFYIISLKKESIKYLGISTLIALIWVSLQKEFYIYENSMVKFLGIDVYPLLAWSLGLLAIKELSNYFKPKNNIKTILIISLIYVMAIILIETISFHIVGFKNTSTQIYPGIPVCNCIHGPVFVQIYYLTIGPVYYIITLFLDKFIKKH